MNYKNSEALKGLELGKSSKYISHYAPELLQAVPRSLNRDEINLTAQSLPFMGCDLWTAFEISWLNSKGKPQVAIADIEVPATSANIIESKSFKLYLNSFNQTQLESIDKLLQCLEKDLSNCAGEAVKVTLYTHQQFQDLAFAKPSHRCIDDLDIDINEYQYRAELLQLSPGNEQVEESICSHLLKSNCLITEQPDWGTLFIEYKGAKIDEAALLKYIISFRGHNEFHEQCVERIFTDLMQHCQCEQLSVYARYTRRGGLDINPYRSNVNAKPLHNQRLARQ